MSSIRIDPDFLSLTSEWLMLAVARQWNDAAFDALFDQSPFYWIASHCEAFSSEIS